jgi:Uma2 family endonuclease
MFLTEGHASARSGEPAMPILIIDPSDQKRLLKRRRLMGGDRQDEVWDGVYIFMPLGDNVHQELGFNLAGAIKQGIEPTPGARIFPGCNVSDQREEWKKNYRCPDVAVFLPGNPAQDRGTFWFGGPDFAVEIMSPYDRSRKKFAFYARVGVRELMLVDRKPWCLELYRRNETDWDLVGKSDAEQSAVLTSAVLPLSFRLIPGSPRPQIEVTQVDGGQAWIA